MQEALTEPVPPQPPEIHWTEIGGLPMVWVDVEEPTAAGLLFRVGWTDEPLHMRGLTHLVEHLALTSLGVDEPYPGNAFTSATMTGFAMNGTPEQVVDFLERVTSGLRDLPLDRLDHEVQVLRAEEHARPPGLSSRLLRCRFGAMAMGWAPTGS